MRHQNANTRAVDLHIDGATRTTAKEHRHALRSIDKLVSPIDNNRWGPYGSTTADDERTSETVIKTTQAGPTPTERLTVSVEEAGRRLGISRSLAYAAARDGRLPTVRFGRRLLVPIQKLDALINTQSGSASDP